MSPEQIAGIVERQRAYFRTHATADVSRRRDALRRLHAAVRAHEDDIARALREDLGKSRDEAYMCEIGLSLSEIRFNPLSNEIPVHESFGRLVHTLNENGRNPV